MDIIVENLDFGNLAGVLLQVRDELSWSYFPDTDLSFKSSWDDELCVMAKCYSSNSTLVSVVNLPELLIIVDAVGSYFSIGPTWEDDFISEKGTNGVNARAICNLVNASNFDSVVIGIPHSHGTINRASYELVWDALHIIGM